MSALAIRLPANGWQPRPYQRALWDYLEAGGKRAAAVWHRRAGKDELCLHWAAVAAHMRPATYWHMLPEASQARKAIWEAVNPHTGKRRIDEAFPLEIRETTRENEMLIRFKSGATWQVVGSDNFDSLVGSPPAGVVFSEWSIANPAAWPMLRPILAENGGWALFIYTPRGENHGYNTLKLARSESDWFSQVLTVDDTKAMPPEILERERRELIAEFGEDDGEAYFQQEFYCSFGAALLGAYYAKLIDLGERDGRIGKVPPETTYPLHTAWDLGVDDSTSIWFIQRAGLQERVVHHYEANGQALQHYVDYIDKKTKELGCRVGTAVLPHDAKVRELGTGKSRVEMLQNMGMQTLIAPQMNLGDGIEATRQFLRTACFDREGCDFGLSALRQYHRERHPQRRVFYDKPVHDWTSHAADALRYYAVSRDLLTNRIGGTEWQPLNYGNRSYA